MKYIEIEKDRTYINPDAIVKVELSETPKTKEIEQPEGALQIPDGTQWTAVINLCDGSSQTLTGRAAAQVRTLVLN